jgi:hypothetical protein
MNPMNNPDERAILENLNGLMQRDEAALAIKHAISIAGDRLAADNTAGLAWEPLPLNCFGPEMPDFIQSSWVFILRSRSTSGAERHPNSHQRMASYRGAGDFQIHDGQQWQSNHLSSEADQELERRWVSIPVNTWHQGVTGDHDWVVVSFHTVPEGELIEERPDPTDDSITHSRTYLG